MSYVIKAVLHSIQRPGYGQITIPFPIPNDQYDEIIEKLQAIDAGFSAKPDCTVDEVDSWYGVLSALEGQPVNADQLDYLAKRLESFDGGEASRFQAMADKLKLADIKDFINLTFCCQQATVITDFSDLERVGKSHALTTNGGAMLSEEFGRVDGRSVALDLIQSGGGTVTPFGVVYDNGMKLEPAYNGQQFPAYFYGDCLMMLEITPKQGLQEGQNPEYLYLPAPEHQIERTLRRAGIDTLSDAQVRLEFDALQDKVEDALDLEHLSGDDIPAFNRMCRAIAPLGDADLEKLNAVVLMTEAADTAAICQLAENLDQFDFVPDVQTPEDYGRYMIQKSGRFDYDENLEGFYDYRAYGEQRIRQEGGQFTECGYVAYHGTMSLEELLRDDPAELYRQELEMGGIV